jgi:hypothetical protein
MQRTWNTPRSVAALLLATFALNGCFAYVSQQGLQAPPQGTEVRLLLSRPLDVPVTSVTVRDVVQLSGEVVGADSSLLRLSAYGLRTAVGYGVLANGETVQVPLNQLGGIQRRRMDPLRSSLVAGAVLGAGLLVAGISGSFSSKGRGSPPPPGQQ